MSFKTVIPAVVVEPVTFKVPPIFVLNPIPIPPVTVAFPLFINPRVVVEPTIITSLATFNPPFIFVLLRNVAAPLTSIEPAIFVRGPFK